MYPLVLQRSFPGAKYILAYGSALYPFSDASSADQIKCGSNTSASRMLDLLIVLDDAKLPGLNASHTSVIGNERAWDVIDPATRVAAQWHAYHRNEFPHHYTRAFRNADPLAVARYQRNPQSPVFYLPFLQFPLSQEQLRPLWCKCGVVSEVDLVKDLMSWSSFHCAGRLQKAFLTFEWERYQNKTFTPSSETVHIPPSSLSNALLHNRRFAVSTALLLLPERFTFATFLYTVLSLSYYGDIRLLFAEDKHKIRKLLHAQCLPLSEIYLPLLLTGIEDCEMPKTLPTSEQALNEPVAPSKTGVSSTYLPNDASQTNASSALLLANARATVPAACAVSAPSMAQVVQLPSCLDGSGLRSTRSVSEDALLALKKTTATMANQAKLRCTESIRGVYSNCMEPLSAEMQDIQHALLSPSFMLQQDFSSDARERLFSKLPEKLQTEATAHSAAIRVRKLLSPRYFMSAKAGIDGSIGKPLPCDPIPVTRALASLTRRTSTITALRAIRTSGMYKSAWYVSNKMAKYIRSS